MALPASLNLPAAQSPIAPLSTAPVPTGVGVLVEPAGSMQVGDPGPAVLRRSRTASGPPSPSRALTIGALAGAVVGGSVLGLVVGIVSPPQPKPATVTVASTPTTSPTDAAAPTPSSSAASPSPTVSVKTIQQPEAAPPGGYIEQPWTDPTLQFFTLEGIWRDEGRVRLKLQPTALLQGEKARAYYEDRDEEPREFAADEIDGPSLELTVREDATIFGEHYLGDHDGRSIQQFSPDQLHDDLRDAVDRDKEPTIWIKRSLDIAGPVIYLAEQYMG